MKMGVDQQRASLRVSVAMPVVIPSVPEPDSVLPLSVSEIGFGLEFESEPEPEPDVDSDVAEVAVPRVAVPDTLPSPETP